MSDGAILGGYVAGLVIFVFIALTVTHDIRERLAWVVVVSFGWPLILIGLPFWAIKTVIVDWRRNQTRRRRPS